VACGSQRCVKLPIEVLFDCYQTFPDILDGVANFFPLSAHRLDFRLKAGMRSLGFL
jgi:hypothetical protein